ncbi:hypothetical protein Ancab_026813 [Ancistrocladus abbreviatus]
MRLSALRVKNSYPSPLLPAAAPLLIIGFYKMQRIYSQLIWSRRSYCASSNSNNDKIVASVLFERLPGVVPKIDPVVYAFQEFSFRCQQQYQRIYPHEFCKKYQSGSLQRALAGGFIFSFMEPCMEPQMRSLSGTSQKKFKNEESLLKRAESALKSITGDLSHTCFVGNAPMAYMVIQAKDGTPDLSLKVLPCRPCIIHLREIFFFNSQVIATNKFKQRMN